ncbi:hypothetical protein PUNSTDRAFT_25885, partial [Punctularia strigosozonata HHB-11173 SS5]|uniref:uncharacterized protein n=1 Tax=Punctularia strigosozonata (strain HHB-11173) TaxID=741275 RepID=UPI000441845F
LDCPAGQTDWYTEFIGETSCTTYQRLRQLCDPEYEVREWIAASPSPGDICDSFDGRCCCNYIAFSLGMLCL